MIARALRTVSRETVLAPVHAWRLVSWLLPPRCRFHPSCSAYAVDAVRGRGVVMGPALAAWRVLRCNPWAAGGLDPVPVSGWPHRAHRADSAAAVAERPIGSPE